jgi:hypothetical protein
VYTYVLQPLMSGQDGITSGDGKSEPSQDRQQQQQLKQLPPPQQQQPEPQQPEQQQAQIEWLRQQQQLALQIVQGGQGAPAAAAAAADGASPRSAELQQQQQQQQQQHSNVSLSSLCSNPHQHASSRHTASCSDSSQSLTALQEARGDLSKLPPEVAAAAAAALPAAVAVSAAVQPVHANSTASSRQHGRELEGGGSDSSSDGGEASQHKSVLVGWELRLVMEFCDAVSEYWHHGLRLVTLLTPV